MMSLCLPALRIFAVILLALCLAAPTRAQWGGEAQREENNGKNA